MDAKSVNRRRVFLSHSSKDKPRVRQIRRDLTSYGVDLWLDEVELLPGDSLYGRIGAAVDSSDRVLAFLSSASVGSAWVRRELNAFLAREEGKQEPMVIPVLLEPVEVPAFLADRLQVRAHTLSPADTTAQILRGVMRHRAVTVAGFESDLPGRAFGMASLSAAISEHIRSAAAGDFLVVLDHSTLTAAIEGSLASVKNDDSDAFLLAWRGTLDYLAALAPRIVATVVAYNNADVSAPSLASRTLATVVRLAVLAAIRGARKRTGDAPLAEAGGSLMAAALADLDSCSSKLSLLLPENWGIGTLRELWLVLLGVPMRDCYDIGFRGVDREDGGVFDANHIYIPRANVREQSLRHRDVSPENEFLRGTWVRYVLPLIAANAIERAVAAASDLATTVPRIGLRLEDYWYFGLE